MHFCELEKKNGQKRSHFSFNVVTDCIIFFIFDYAHSFTLILVSISYLNQLIKFYYLPNSKTLFLSTISYKECHSLIAKFANYKLIIHYEESNREIKHHYFAL